MGIAYTWLKRWDEAERAIRDAIAIRERLVAADAGNREDRRGLTVLQGALSNVLRERGSK